MKFGLEAQRKGSNNMNRKYDSTHRKKDSTHKNISPRVHPGWKILTLSRLSRISSISRSTRVICKLKLYIRLKIAKKNTLLR